MEFSELYELYSKLRKKGYEVYERAGYWIIEKGDFRKYVSDVVELEEWAN